MRKRILAGLFLVLLATQFGCAGANRLSYAAISGNMQEVEQSVKSGAQVNEIDRWGWTPLLWSIYYGNTEVTKYLLKNGADPNLKSQLQYGIYLPGTSPLILAATYGRDDAVEALLKHKANRGDVDAKGKKAIDYAKEYNFDKCVALLQGK